MLTAATKRKIDTARDILVGKIPVPTSQVEQITLALVYKFMSDMDKRAKDLGDSSGFFANGYGKYAWDNLMDKALPARDRVLLYREALEKMSLNPHIPQLFRDVFRDASLPFNDPETLKLFLDVIDQFEYDHSEELGNAFEYLLQVMGSQGDAGQFRTPRHIIDFIVDVVEPSKTDKILDPACGTAGFLISAYNHIKNKGLSADEMTQLSENFVGYDISQDMQRLSLVNLYLHHFPNPHIYEYDTLTSEDRWNDDFDVILANPPFMTPKGGIRPHNRFSVPSKRAEVLFVDYIMEHLTVRGKAGVIVPEGIIFQSQNAYKQLRKMMVESNYLWAVVSLPSGVFNPYSGVKTSILLFDREIAKKTDKILFVKINNDGFDLGAQRKSVEGSQIEEATRILRKYKQDPTIAQDKLEEYAEDVASKIELRGKDLKNYETVAFEPITPQLVKKSEIAKSGDYNLSGERYVENKKRNSEYPLVKLGELLEVQNGFAFKSQFFNESGRGLPVIRIRDVNSGFSNTYYEGEYDEKYVVEDGDLLIGMDGDFKATIWDHGKALLNQRVCRLQNFKKIEKTYVFFMIQSQLDVIHKKAFSVTVKHLSSREIEGIEIPLPPLSVQQEIVAELDRYQKIIDGAKQVVENYKPDFEVKEEWEWVELGDVCTTFSGGTPKRGISEYWNGDIPWVKTAEVDYDLIEGTQEKITEKGLAESSAKLADPGTILMALYGQGKTRGRVAKLGIKAAMNQACLAIVPNKSLDNDFLFYFLQISYERLRSMSIGGNQSNLSATLVQKLKIPLPPIQEQRAIAASIRTEQEGIRSVEKMIPSFEQKIHRKISQIWNEK